MRYLKQTVGILLLGGLAILGPVGCSSSHSDPPPVAPAISTHPANQTVTEGGTATFTLTATGTAPLAYQWKKGATAVTGATSASYTTPATVLADNGSSFTVTVTNAAGSITSNAATLTVNPAAVAITSHPAAANVLAGAQATFSVTATGSAPMTYQWKKDTVDLAGATASTYTTPATTLAMNGASYTVVVTNGAGSLTSNAAILTVETLPAITADPAGTTVNVGAAVTFTSAASGNPAPVLQWYKNGTALTGKTGPTLTIASAALADAGSYTARATNSRGTATSAAAILVVNQAATITTQPASQTIVAGGPVTFTVVATGFPAVTYQWKKAGIAIGGATGASYTIASVTPADAAAYTVDVSNSLGTVTSNPAVLTVTIPVAITTQPANQTVTAPATATFTVAATGSAPIAYQWQKNGTAITGATSATYTTPATTLADNQASFTVVVSNGAGNPATSTAAILTVNVAPAFTAQPADRSIVVGQTATFSAAATGNPAPTYQWRKGGVAIGGANAASYTTPVAVIGDDLTTFDVVASNGIGSPATSNAATLHVAPQPVTPTFLTQPASQVITQGSPVTFTVTLSGVPTPTVQWALNGTNIAGATGLSYTIAAVTPAHAGTYTAIATNTQGNVTSNAAVLTVNYAPVITTQPQPQSVNLNGTATFSVVANAVPAITGYQWRFNGTDLPGGNGATLTLSGVTNANAGSYTVLVTNSVGSTLSNAAALTVAQAYNVSGMIVGLNNGPGLPGVTVSINTTPVQTTLTDGTGHFTLTGIVNGTYAVTPSFPAGSGLFFPASQSVTIAGTDQNNLQFQGALSYTLSGTIQYGGAKTGRVFITLTDANGNPGPGVSIPAPGPYSIRGVIPGTYTVSAWMDTVGLASPNASNPKGYLTNASFGGTGGGFNVTLIDPAAINLTGTAGPILKGASPFNGGIVLFYQMASDPNGNETADAYLMEASTTLNFTTIAKSLTTKAVEHNNKASFMAGLTDGVSYYFRCTAKAGATSSNPGTPIGPVTVGQPTGGNTLTGTVTFPGTATGPLSVGVFSQATGAMHLVSIPNPVSPQAFTLPGVPNGTYFFFGLLDQNQNGSIDPGDISNTNSSISSQITVAGNMSGQNLTLLGVGATANLSTQHNRATASAGIMDWYSLGINVDMNLKLPVNVTLVVNGAFLDVGKTNSSGYSHWLDLGTLRPAIGDGLTIQVGYSDNTADDFPVQVTTVLDTFATNMVPTTGLSHSLTPTFSWSAPSPAPAFPYTYFIGIYPAGGGGNFWEFDGLPSSTTSVLYNFDGSAQIPALSLGSTYYWMVRVTDVAGNSSTQQAVYKP